MVLSNIDGISRMEHKSRVTLPYQREPRGGRRWGGGVGRGVGLMHNEQNRW